MNPALNNSSSSLEVSTLLYTLTDGASVLVCLFAVVLVVARRLYKKVVYRLALYQVLAGLAFATVGVFQIIFIHYADNPQAYSRVCTAIGWSAFYTQWVKLVFTMWVTIHLFCFGVLYYNLNRFEGLYVATALIAPAVVAMVPLATDSYGLEYDACYIYVRNDTRHVAVIERFALWNGPAIVILFAASVAMAVMVIKLAHKVCRRSVFEPITEGDQYWKALKQLLPLAAFPVLFFVFIIPVVMFDGAIYKANDQARVLVPTLLIPLWSMASGVTLIIHVSVSLLCTHRKRKRLRDVSGNTPDRGTVGRPQETRKVDVNSVTDYLLPKDSLVGDS